MKTVKTLTLLLVPTVLGNANELSFFELNSSGVNTPIPKIQTAYTEPMASASPYFIGIAVLGGNAYEKSYFLRI